MKIIVGQESEQGIEIVGNKEENTPLVFDTAEEAVDYMVQETNLPIPLVSAIFNFYEVTDEELAEMIATVTG